MEEDATATYRRILVVLEQAEHAQAAVIEGVELARVAGAELVFLRLAAAPPENARVPAQDAQPAGQIGSDRRAAAALRAAARACVAARVESGGADWGGAEVAAAAAELGCDLIIVASNGDNAVARLLGGSVVPGLITAATVSVVVCPGQTDLSPSGDRRRRPRRAMMRARRVRSRRRFAPDTGGR